MPPASLVEKCPTEVEAWLALQPIEEELDQHTQLASLKAAMLSRWFDVWRPLVVIDFDMALWGVLWRDKDYRALLNNMATTGATRECFRMMDFKILRSLRLVQHWDKMLNDLVDWIRKFAGGHDLMVTLEDVQKIVACVPETDKELPYKERLGDLFPRRDSCVLESPLSFLSKLSPEEYSNVYNVLQVCEPHKDWDPKKIMDTVRREGPTYKSIMLHVCFWFNPDLKEPGNRDKGKDAVFHHLKPAFSSPNLLGASSLEKWSWEDRALKLQDVVLRFVRDKWLGPKRFDLYSSTPLKKKLGPQVTSCFSDMNWNELLKEVRRTTDAQFRHPHMLKWNIPAEEIPGFLQWKDESGNLVYPDSLEAMLRQPHEFIAGKYISRCLAAPHLAVRESTSPDLPQQLHSEHQAAQGIQTPQETLPNSCIMKSRTSGISSLVNKRKAQQIDPELVDISGKEDTRSTSLSQLASRIRRSKIDKLALPRNSTSAVVPGRKSLLPTQVGDQVLCCVAGSQKERTAENMAPTGRWSDLDEAGFLREFEARGEIVRVETLDLSSYTPSSTKSVLQSLVASPRRRRRKPNTPSFSPRLGDIGTMMAVPAAPDTIVDLTTDDVQNSPNPYRAMSWISISDDETQIEDTEIPIASSPIPILTPAPASAPAPSTKVEIVTDDIHDIPTPCRATSWTSITDDETQRKSFQDTQRFSSVAASILSRSPVERAPEENSPGLHWMESSAPLLLPPRTQTSASSNETRSKTEKAISLLQDAYGEELDMKTMLRAITCLKDEVDAGIFITLKPGKLRDTWLKCLIGSSNRK